MKVLGVRWKRRAFANEIKFVKNFVVFVQIKDTATSHRQRRRYDRSSSLP